MDLPVIGSHCSLSSCRDLDLLPIRCRCDHLFCRHHISPESHDCPIDPAANNPAPELPFQKLERCAADKCHKPSLASFITSASDETSRSSATCPRCQKAFCASHRYPQSHSCSVSAPALPSKNSTAGQALLAKHFPQTSRSATSTSAPHVPSDPKKRAQLLKVQLMKMRHHAIPGDLKDKLSFVLVDQRLHVKVKLEDPKHQYKEGIFWFRKTVGTGKALDCLAIHLGIPCSDISPRQLLKLSEANPEECTSLRNDQPLSSQVEEGSTLVLAPIVLSSD